MVVLGAGRGQSELNTPSDGIWSGQGGGRRRCGCGAHARREITSSTEWPSDGARSGKGGGRRRGMVLGAGKAEVGGARSGKGGGRRRERIVRRRGGFARWR
ncbi:hypothetical protein GUJ93_ZPchr0020g33561 [Zizania palustris]|uniref:Uncharacterized protein n=1 Tax=Zizania palustris TaxID=103762 RepID=A0A8J5UR78_ZIZPA|nr:hypothetical protein GUJ93_ZPchr0020g33561 [Zizania palustris]